MAIIVVLAAIIALVTIVVFLFVDDDLVKPNNGGEIINEKFLFLVEEESTLIKNDDIFGGQVNIKNEYIKELNDGWEDYEEPKGYWYYDTTCGRVEKLNHNEDKEIDSSIGNCFETKEEAEKAVEKLKAWKRLKDKGISFKPKVINRRWYLAPKAKHEQATFDEAKDLFKDIMFIFGGKE